MRNQIRKLTKGHSTKAERRFMELCKELRIPFQTKVNIDGREVDFLVKHYAIEIDGHEQDVSKNFRIIKAGYTPCHFYNWEIKPSLKEWLKKL
jgi:very-short-patch-repair endonuclease